MTPNEIATRADIEALREEIAALKAVLLAMPKQAESLPYMTTDEAMVYLRIKSRATFLKRCRDRGIVKTGDGLYLRSDVQKMV